MQVGNATIAILGGYGQLGDAVARVLLSESDARIQLIGRDAAKLQTAISRLRAQFPADRVTGCVGDARTAESWLPAVKGARLLVVCTTDIRHMSELTRAVLAARIDCVDLRYPQNLFQSWRACAAEIERAGCSVLTQAGHLPGLPGVFFRYARSRHPSLRTAVLATGIRPRHPLSSGAAAEMVGVLRDGGGGVFRRGRWLRGGLSRIRSVNLARGFGRRLCMPVVLEELRDVPASADLDELACYVAGFNGFVSGVVSPLAMTLGRLDRAATNRFLADLMVRGTSRFARPPFGAVMQVEAQGQDGVFRMNAGHEDSYYFAAAAVVAGLEQFFEGALARRGLWVMGREAEPVRLIQSLRRMGVAVEESFDAKREPHRELH